MRGEGEHTTAPQSPARPRARPPACPRASFFQPADALSPPLPSLSLTKPASAVIALFGTLVLAFFAVNVALWWAANAGAGGAAAAGGRRTPKAASKKKMRREAARRGAMQVLGD
jgi:hypothetical protein